MFEQKLTKNLREGEALVAVIRRAPIVELGRAALAVGLFLVPFFLLIPLFRFGAWGVAIFIGAIVSGVVYGFRTWFVWSVNAFVLTNERIIDVDQHGFFTTEVSSAAYGKIQDVSFSIRGLWPTVFKIGRLEIQTAGSDLRLELTGVREPQRVQERILQVMRDHADPSGDDAAGRILAALERIESQPHRKRS